MEKKNFSAQYTDLSISKIDDSIYNIEIYLKPMIKGKDVVAAYGHIFTQIDNWANENKIQIINLKIEKNDVVHYLLPYYLSMFQQYFQTPFSIHGFIPVTVLPKEDNKIIELFYNRDKIDEKSFLQMFFTDKYVRYSKNKIMDILAKTGNSNIIYYLYPKELDTYLYPKSKRPKTTMQNLGMEQKQLGDFSLTSTTVSGVDLYQNILGSDKNNYYIPVTRYGSETSGLYFVAKSKKYCGTFYYYESDSSYLLQVPKNKILIFDNKYNALDYIYHSYYDFFINDQTLLEKVENAHVEVLNKIEDVIVEVLGKEMKDDVYESGIASDFIAGIYDGISGYDKISGGKMILGFGNNYLTKEGKYTKYIDKFYAIEDELDQPLCRSMQLVNIDVIIFTKMVGSGRTVVEVLDARDREVSYSSIYKINE